MLCGGMGVHLHSGKHILVSFSCGTGPCQVPGSQLFASLQAPERPGRAHGHENHTTLPADWKHRREPLPGSLDRGRCLEATAPSEGGGVQPSTLLHRGVCVWVAGQWAAAPGEAAALGGGLGGSAVSVMPPLPLQGAAAWTGATATATATVTALAHTIIKVLAWARRAGEPGCPPGLTSSLCP